MIDGALILWTLAAVLAVIAWRRGPDVFQRGMTHAGRSLIASIPRIGLAMLAAGFIGTLLPTGPIARLIGPDSGVTGILIASVAGGFVPSGPIVSFPVIVVLRDAGAGTAQLIAFLTAWSVFAFHRVLIHESPIMGWAFSAQRLGASLILPPLSGLAAMAGLKILALLGIA